MTAVITELDPLALSLFRSWKRYLVKGYPEIDLPSDDELWEMISELILALISDLESTMYPEEGGEP